MKKEVIFITLLIIVDQIVKVFATKMTSSIVLINNFLQLNYVENRGVAWSMLNEKRIIIILFSIIGIGYLFKLMIEFRKELLVHIGIMMMIAGGIGNIIDRIFRHFVVDYVDVVIFGYDFPVFNIADMFLVCGVALILVEMIRKVKNGETL